MTRFSDQYDELLSSYFDGEATAEEKIAVEKLLESSPDAVARLQSLSEIRHSLKSIAKQSIGRDLSINVIAAARAGARQLNLPPDHHVLVAEGTRKAVLVPSTTLGNNESRRVAVVNWGPARVIGVLGALAATIMLAIFSYRSILEPTADQFVANTDGPVESLPVDHVPIVDLDALENKIASSTTQRETFPEKSAQTVGEILPVAPSSLLLVVDVSATSNAWNNNALGKILDEANIRTGSSVMADRSITDSLEKSFMIIKAPDNSTNHKASSPRVAVLFVEAEGIALDRAISVIFSRAGDFPQASMNIAYQRTEVELFAKLRSGLSAQPLTQDGSKLATAGTALPIIVRDVESTNVDSIAQFSNSNRYVSSSNRAKSRSMPPSSSQNQNLRSEAMFVVREQLEN